MADCNHVSQVSRVLHSKCELWGVGNEVLCKLVGYSSVGRHIVLYLKIERAYVIELMMKCTNTRPTRIEVERSNTHSRLLEMRMDRKEQKRYNR